MRGMKRALIVILAALAMSVIAAPPAPPPILLTVKKGRPANETQERMYSIDINLRNGGTNVVNAELEWYFISSPVGGFGYYVSGRGKQPVKLEARKTLDLEKTTALIVTKDVKGKGGKTAKLEVAQTKGHIVRLLNGGKVMDVQSEPSFIKRKAQDPAEFKALLDTPAPDFK